MIYTFSLDLRIKLHFLKKERKNIEKIERLIV